MGQDAGVPLGGSGHITQLQAGTRRSVTFTWRCPGGSKAFSCDINLKECWYTEEKSGERGNPREVGLRYVPS